MFADNMEILNCAKHNSTVISINFVLMYRNINIMLTGTYQSLVVIGDMVSRYRITCVDVNIRGHLSYMIKINCP